MSFVFPITPSSPLDVQTIIDNAVLTLEISLAGVINSLITNLQTTISTVVASALATAVSTLNTTISAVTAAVNAAITTLSGLINTLTTEVQNLLTAAITDVQLILNNLLAFVKDVLNRVEQELATFRFLLLGGIVVIGGIGLGLLYYQSQRDKVVQEELADRRMAKINRK